MDCATDSSGSTDLRWMHQALELAARGRCGASPNPMVGAVVLDAEGRVVGRGFHAAFGGDHAEVVALREAADRANGGTLYVTLEPCNHHGKTPPCVDAVVAAGLRRVVVACRDPNPQAAGGIEQLQQAGLAVECGVAEEPARALNRRWLHRVSSGLPSITLKTAVSMDGRIATRTGESQWITGEAARHRSLELREEHDAILVGIGTVLADDPHLTRRLGLNPVPRWRRIILDSSLRTPVDARVVRYDPHLTTIAHIRTAPDERRQRLADAGVRLLELPACTHDRAGEGRTQAVDRVGEGRTQAFDRVGEGRTQAFDRVDLAALLVRLGEEGVAALLVEGGACINGAFCDNGMVNEVYLFLAPMLIGGPAPAAVAGNGVCALQDAPRFSIIEVGSIGEDIIVHAVRSEGSWPEGKAASDSAGKGA